MAVETNPIQQRMEYLTDLWNDIPKKGPKIIRTIIEKGDEGMIEAFYTYMLGINVPIRDIAINFSMGFDEVDTFSENLIRELEGIVNLWNEADFSSTSLDKVMIDWKPDYSITNKNEAWLFTINMNKLTETLDLQKGRFLVANLTLPYIVNKKEIRKWLEYYLSTKQHPQLKLLITDTKGEDFYQDLSSMHGNDISDWEPHIDTSNVISKVAAMGDPDKPDTAYRLSFTNMIKGMSENKSDIVRKEGKKCLEIACNHVDKDPNWIAQVVMVNIVLSNDCFKNHQYNEALQVADEAIKIGGTVPAALGETMGCGILAQAEMNKAIMLSSEKKWKESIELYASAANNLCKSKIYIAAMDAYRMAAWAAKKDYRQGEALDYLVNGYELGDRIDDRTLRGGSFSLLLLQLTKMNYREKIDPKELNAKATQVFGDNWEEVIRQKWTETNIGQMYEDDPYVNVTQPDLS